MKTYPIALRAGLILGCGLAAALAGWAEQSPPPANAPPLQAIQQAPDPSAAVAAYANGSAIARDDPRINEAYVARMVDFGLPEMAYHQARMLTTLQPKNGLAWGVVAYVDARRGQMTDAILAINQAGQLAPDNPFVAHTAGELAAWYDLRADKTTLPENAKAGLAKIRDGLAKQTTFKGAYDTACRAYQAQARAQAQPTQAAPAQYAPAPQALPAAPGAPPPQAPSQGDLVAPLGYAEPPPPPAYYPDYSDSYYAGAPDFYDDWGPDWTAPGCWWGPCGFWGGGGFFPFGIGYVGYGGRFGDRDRWGRHGGFGPGGDSGVWHRGVNGRNSFFGTPARPSGSVARLAREGPPSPAARTTAGTGLHGSGTAGEAARVTWSGRTDYSFSHPTARVETPGGRAFGSYRALPAYSVPGGASPRYSAPSSFGEYRTTPNYGAYHGGGYSGSMRAYRGGYHGGGGGYHGGGGGYHGGGGGYHGGGGGFHGGGFGGGGHGGGGHR